MARPTKYSADMLAKAKEYLVNYDQYDHATPSVVGLARVLGVCTRTVQTWDDKEFLRTLQQIKDEQHFKLVNSGLKNEFNSNITKLMLANFGHSDKQQVEQSGVTVVKIKGEF